MLTLDTTTQPATLGRLAPASWAQCAYLEFATPIPAVGPTGVGGFGKGSSVPTAAAAKARATHVPALPAKALPVKALPATTAPITARMTDQTPAVAANDGSLGNHVRRRPPV